MKTYLVTGGAGFIGSNFILYMLAKYNDIKIVNLDALTYAGDLKNLKDIEKDPAYLFVRGDIRDRAFVELLFREHNFDIVVNFAAESHVDRSIEGPGIFAETNVTGTLNLLNAARFCWHTEKSAARYIQISTDEVYGSLGDTGYFTETTPLDPHSPYSASKAAADLFVKAFYDTYRFPAVITRCSNNYGPRQFPEKLIPLVITRALKHEAIPVYGDGLNVRDWIHADDHCKAIDLVIQGGRPGEVYNIGGNNEHKNINIIKTILSYIKSYIDPSVDETLIEYVPDRKGHDRRYGIDPSKIQKELGWKAEVPFDEGIWGTIDYYSSSFKG